MKSFFIGDGLTPTYMSERSPIDYLKQGGDRLSKLGLQRQTLDLLGYTEQRK